MQKLDIFIRAHVNTTHQGDITLFVSLFYTGDLSLYNNYYNYKIIFVFKYLQTAFNQHTSLLNAGCKYRQLCCIQVNVHLHLY